MDSEKEKDLAAQKFVFIALAIGLTIGLQFPGIILSLIIYWVWFGRGHAA